MHICTFIPCSLEAMIRRVGSLSQRAARSFHTTGPRLNEVLPASVLSQPIGKQATTTATAWIDHILCEFQYPADITVFELARRNGINIPHFCYNRNLPIAGNCRMCMCHRVADKKYAIACNEIVEPNTKYITVDDTLKNIRQYVLEFMLANHSLDCPICDQVCLTKTLCSVALARWLVGCTGYGYGIYRWRPCIT